jgi:UDP-2-acetamido-3-amino-2,3-dideoxy-glucuronate N-acetyltransferase
MVFTNVYNPRSAIRRMDELRPIPVKKGASTGANATIMCGIATGSYSFIGAGAVVLRDVPDHALVVSNPAKRKGWMSACGVQLVFNEGETVCQAFSRNYQKGEPEQIREISC